MADRILLVEDDLADQMFIRQALKQDHPNVEVTMVGDGDAALDFLRQNPNPGMILLDLNMPGMDGKTLLEKLKYDPVLKLIPAVVLSTADADAEIRACYERHANAYIVKPDTLDGYRRVAQRLKDFWFQEVRTVA